MLLGTVMAPWRQLSAQPAAAADAAAALKHVFVIQSFPSESGDLQNMEGGVSAGKDRCVTARVCANALVVDRARSYCYLLDH